MTVYILSVGRSGSGWLSTALMATGLSVSHEWFGSTRAKPDVVADTSLIWNPESFIASLSAIKDDGSVESNGDVVIFLERPLGDVQRSVDKLLGKRDWTDLFNQWYRIQEMVKATKTHNVTIKYDELFTDEGATKVWAALLHTPLIVNRQRMYEVWGFMRHMNVQNMTAMGEVKRSLGVEE